MEILSGDNPANFRFSGSNVVLFGSGLSLLKPITADSSFSTTSSLSGFFSAACEGVGLEDLA